MSNKNAGESASTSAALMLNKNTNSPADEVGKAIATATGTSSSYASPRPPPQQHQPSVTISLSDITEMLDPFFGTSTTLPSSSQQQQQQRGGPHHERNTDVTAEGPTNKDVHTEEETPCSPVELPRGLTSGDEKRGKVDDNQGMEEFMEAPGNSWMDTVWEMEMDKSRMVP